MTIPLRALMTAEGFLGFAALTFTPTACPPAAEDTGHQSHVPHHIVMTGSKAVIMTSQHDDSLNCTDDHTYITFVQLIRWW